NLFFEGIDVECSFADNERGFVKRRICRTSNSAKQVSRQRLEVIVPLSWIVNVFAWEKQDENSPAYKTNRIRLFFI
ncbi:MAG: hypothetical protein ACHQD7_03815, partial [Chitinophagales bacterium]